MGKKYLKILILLYIIFSVLCFSGCDRKNASITLLTSNPSKNSTSNFETNTASGNKTDYMKLLPNNYNWIISKTSNIILDDSFTIVSAYCERDNNPMLGQFFVFSKDKLLWKSSEYETSSILDTNIHILRVDDRALIFGEYVSGGARGMMYSGITFTINPHKSVKEENSGILLGLDGDVTQTNNSIILKGELIKNQFELTIKNKVYNEKTIITDIKNWEHPVKTVFDNYSIELNKVELTKNMTYPTFYLENSNRLLDECYYSDFMNIAKANGFWSYKIIAEDSNVSIEVVCDRNKKRLIETNIYSQDINRKNTNVGKSTIKYHQNIGNSNKLSANDFKIIIHGLRIENEMSVAEITEKIGMGTANENNNYGYIGRSPDGHDRRRYGYQENNIAYDLISLDEGDLERIDLNKTKKGLAIGDNLNKLIKLYGNPDFEILRDSNKISEYIYSYKDKQFIVQIQKGKVAYISLQFINLYEF